MDPVRPMPVSERAWQSPAPRLTLEDGEIHVWRASLDRPAGAVDSMRRTLSADERQRASRFRFERDRERFAVGRGVLRRLCGLYLDLDPGQIRFSYGPRGKPSLAPGHRSARLGFNLAHSGSLALYAFTRGGPIGVDVEHVRPLPDADDLAARFFSACERETYGELPPGQKPLGFYLCWTRKEAFVKALGEGLSLPLDSFDVSLAPGEPARLLQVAPDPDEAARWSLYSLEPRPAFVGAVAVRGRNQQLLCWDCC